VTDHVPPATAAAGDEPQPRRPRRHALHPGLRLGVLAVVVGTAFLIVALSGSLSADRVRDWIDGFGVAGPIAFIVVSTVLNCAFFPGPLLAGASGLLFGTALGTPVAIVAASLSALVACSLSRFLAGDAVQELGGRRVKGMAAFVERRGFLSVLYVRLLPGVPYTLFNYAVGLTRVSLVAFTLATALGTAPRTFAYVALGGSFGDFGNAETIIAVAVLVVMGIGGPVAGALTRSGPGTGSSSPGGRSAGLP
jgi:uncharacterized membrane protein YdjX (TVP38/TMEM64 family)